jgi:putative FmdB family regulatory protein
MPIYEFYCVHCHTVFNFLSRTIETKKRPACPHCKKPRLERRASTFAVRAGRLDGNVDDLPPDIDSARMEQAINGLAREADGLNEDDPRAMAGLMRRFYAGSGAPIGPGMNEALVRFESGEDPETIEAELGSTLEAEDPFAGQGPVLRHPARLPQPAVDPELHEL